MFSFCVPTDRVVAASESLIPDAMENEVGALAGNQFSDLTVAVLMFFVLIKSAIIFCFFLSFRHVLAFIKTAI